MSTRPIVAMMPPHPKKIPFPFPLIVGWGTQQHFKKFNPQATKALLPKIKNLQTVICHKKKRKYILKHV